MSGGFSSVSVDSDEVDDEDDDEDELDDDEDFTDFSLLDLIFIKLSSPLSSPCFVNLGCHHVSDLGASLIYFRSDFVLSS